MEERAELTVACMYEGGPILLNVDAVDNSIYATEEKYDGAAFVSPVMVQRRTLNPHYLYLNGGGRV